MRNIFIDRIQVRDSLATCDSYLANLPIVRNLLRKQQLTFRQPITFLVGENGTGKSTLLEAIAVAHGFNAEGGSKNFQFSTYASHSELYTYLTLIKKDHPKDGFFLRAESFYNVATEIEKLDDGNFYPPLHDSYGGKSLHDQSHGESFLALVKNRFLGNGLYILDEPEAALSPSHQLSLLAMIYRLAKDGSQFIIATHSPILFTCPGAQIYELTEKDIQVVNYAETEHFQLTRMYLENPERMLKHLLEE